ncbi:MAG: MFS transporter [Candidatus Heimdallarchaeota archaeon]|nr:MAG: MFS transporter [Candidatus Heimdallarchaeota archaeon]
MTEFNKNEEKTDTNVRGYLVFLVGQWISMFGSNVVGFSIIWFLTVTTGSTFVLGLATFLNFAPFIIATPVAGVFIDRWSRKKVIAFVDFMQAFFTVVLIGFFLMDVFSPLELVAILLTLNTIRALFGAFHTSAVDTLLPIMVPKKHYSRINGINYLVNGIIGGIAGPIIGAYTLEVLLIPLKTILWLDVITFLVAILPTVLIYFPKVKKRVLDEKEKTSFKSEFSEGMKFIKETPGLFALLFVFAGANLFMTPFYIQLPLFVTAIHLGGASQLAFLLTAQQSGMLIGSIVMSTWKGFENHAKGVALALFMGYFGFAIMVSAPFGYFALIGIGLFIAGFTLPAANVSSEAIWASTVPQEILGRVYAVRRTLAQITAPLAMLLSGIIAEFINLSLVLLVCTVCGLLVLGYSWFFTKLPEVEKMIEINEKTKIQPTPS